jgi:hypothetical protein
LFVVAIFRYDITGTTSGAVENALDVYLGAPASEVVVNVPLTGDAYIESAPIAVVGGVEYRLSSHLFFGAGYETGSNGADGTGSANFANTVRLRPLVITDGAGIPIPGASILASSGTDYGGDAIPEPGTLVLISAGLLIVSLKPRRQRTH